MPGSSAFFPFEWSLDCIFPLDAKRVDFGSMVSDVRSQEQDFIAKDCERDESVQSLERWPPCDESGGGCMALRRDVESVLVEPIAGAMR
jgi:hypothetical protein